MTEAQTTEQHEQFQTPADKAQASDAIALEEARNHIDATAQDEPQKAQDEFAEEEAAEQPVNQNALRGVPAGPPPHPRTV